LRQIEREAASRNDEELASRYYFLFGDEVFLSDDEVDAAAGAAAGAAGAVAEVLSLLDFESLVDFESAPGFESLLAVLLPSLEDLGLALP
jgi:hypothetical protein